MGWLIFAGVVAALTVLPLGIWLRYDAGGALIRIVAGPLKITVFPRKKKEKKAKKAAPVKKEPPVEKPKEQSLPKPLEKPQTSKSIQKEKGGSITDFLPLVKVALDLLGDFRRKLRLDEVYLCLIMASSDPCDLAVNYGRAWAAVGNLIPQLERLFVIKKRDIEVQCDFEASQTLVIAQLKLTITLGRLLALLTVYGLRAVKEYFAMKKKRKGGAVT